MSPLGTASYNMSSKNDAVSWMTFCSDMHKLHFPKVKLFVHLLVFYYTIFN